MIYDVVQKMRFKNKVLCNIVDVKVVVKIIGLRISFFDKRVNFKIRLIVYVQF